MLFRSKFTAGDITLSGAIQYLRSVTGLNFVLSQKVKEDKADTEIDINLNNVSVRQVLDLITEPNEMAWKVRNGVVMILAKEEALDKAVQKFLGGDRRDKRRLLLHAFAAQSTIEWPDLEALVQGAPRPAAPKPAKAAPARAKPARKKAKARPKKAKAKAKVKKAKAKRKR